MNRNRCTTNRRFMMLLSNVDLLKYYSLPMEHIWLFFFLKEISVFITKMYLAKNRARRSLLISLLKDKFEANVISIIGEKKINMKAFLLCLKNSEE